MTKRSSQAVTSEPVEKTNVKKLGTVIQLYGAAQDLKSPNIDSFSPMSCRNTRFEGDVDFSKSQKVVATDFRGAVFFKCAKFDSAIFLPDFMSDALWVGRRYRTFDVLNDFNREALLIAIDFNLPAPRVVLILDNEHLTRIMGEENGISLGCKFIGLL